MFKHFIKIALFFVLSLSLAACSGISIAGLTGSSSQTSNNPLAVDSSTLDVSEKLGVGILELQSANLPITAEQADTLLPLWQAVKAISAESNGSTVEMDALYQQIQESLTTEQVQAIENMTWTETQLVALYQQHGAQTAQVDQTTSSDSTSSSSTASNASSSGQGPNGGGGPADGGVMMGGGPSGGMGDISMTGSMGTSSSSSQVSQTDLLIQAATTSSGISDLNTTFASAVINLLQNTINA